jgi:hypothetical protein
MAYAEPFQPVAKPLENLCLIKSGAQVQGYYVCKYVEPLPEHTYDFAPSAGIAAGETDSENEISDLYLDDLQLGQYRFYVVDDIQVSVRQPLAKTKWTTKGVKEMLSPFTQQVFRGLQHMDIFVWEDEKVYFDAKNPTKYTIYKARVRYIGYHYILAKLEKAPEKFTIVPIEAPG